jgi:hypothetical protein
MSSRRRRTVARIWHVETLEGRSLLSAVTSLSASAASSALAAKTVAASSSEDEAKPSSTLSQLQQREDQAEDDDPPGFRGPSTVTSNTSASSGPSGIALLPAADDRGWRFRSGEPSLVTPSPTTVVATLASPIPDAIGSDRWHGTAAVSDRRWDRSSPGTASLRADASVHGARGLATRDARLAPPGSSHRQRDGMLLPRCAGLLTDVAHLGRVSIERTFRRFFEASGRPSVCGGWQVIPTVSVAAPLALGMAATVVEAILARVQRTRVLGAFDLARGPAAMRMLPGSGERRGRWSSKTA